VQQWRGRLIAHLRERPEGFTDGTDLIPGRPYPPSMPHAVRG
jgi:arylsulfatase